DAAAADCSGARPFADVLPAASDWRGIVDNAVAS
ncbi:MAG: hypothetical protein K0R58_4141, partial [Ramlibacter sp.]|nr:hypothetical protein [Ramlibacter sp.]